MAASAKPSPAIVAAAVAAFCVSAALFLVAMFSALVGVFAYVRPTGPRGASQLAVLGAVLICGLLTTAAASGITTAIGLLRLRAWARTAALAGAGVLVCSSGMTILATLTSISTVMATTPQAAPVVLRVILIAVSAVLFSVGTWWLILFTRKGIAAEFDGPLVTLPHLKPIASVEFHANASEPTLTPAWPEPFTIIRARSALGRVFLAALATFGAVIILLVATRIALGRSGTLGSPLTLSLVQIFFYGFTVLFILRLLRRGRLTPGALIGRPLGWEQIRSYWTLPLLLFGISLTGYVLLYFPLSFAFPRFVDAYAVRAGNQQLLHYTGFGYRLSNLVSMLGSVVAAPIVEEFVFRGILLTRWSIKWGTPRAILLSAAIFGVLHVEILGHMFFGYVMAVLYIETKSLYAPMLMHAVNNGLVWALTLVRSTGGPTPTETLTSLQTGGRYSLIVFSAIFLPWAVWFLIRHFPRRDWKVPYLQFKKALPE